MGGGWLERNGQGSARRRRGEEEARRETRQGRSPVAFQASKTYQAGDGHEPHVAALEVKVRRPRGRKEREGREE